MIGVPDGVDFSYNGYVFNSSVKTRVTEEPITSGDNRVVKYSKITISVSGYITQADADGGVGAVQGDTIDEIMNTIRRTLQVHGKNLKYVNKGYGVDLDVNNATPDQNSITDVAMGPKAGKLTWFSLGGAPDGCHGAAFEWEVSTCIAECENFPLKPGPSVFVEISYTVNYDVGEDGLVVITTSGNLQIPLSLVNGFLPRTIDDSLDGNVIRVKPIGFMRKHSRQISADRASCSFTIVDRQVEVAYPNDVVAIDMRHRIKQTINGASPTWNGTFNATIRLSPTADKFIAARRFFSIVAQRLLFARNNKPIRGTRPTIMMMTTEMEENLFMNEATFSVSYMMTGAPIAHVINVSGLWRAVSPGVIAAGAADNKFDHQTSHDSLIGNAQLFKGIRLASFDKSGDVIIDVCAGPPPEPAAPPQERTHGVNIAQEAESANDDELEGIEVDGENIEAPEAEGTWVDWHCDRQLIVNHHLVHHTPLQGSVDYDVQKYRNPFGALSNMAAEDRPPEINWSTDNVSTVQQIGPPSIRLRLVGYAIRIGLRVRPPIAVSYGGRDLYLASEVVNETTLCAYGSLIMFRTDWDLTYIVLSPPDGLPLPTNPFLQIEGDTPVES